MNHLLIPDGEQDIMSESLGQKVGRHINHAVCKNKKGGREDKRCFLSIIFIRRSAES
ncbi:hypothetical protein ACFOU2_21580 [Bacillus songklensis]|uniref:Uncharacterized protein n=1 Tax=Bacillus songklensis TaxID=1069116 RepID=A0ABV8B7Q6_9BACI